LISSLLAAWALRPRLKLAAIAAPATTTEDFFRKSRREGFFVSLIVDILLQMRV
jgi:hypothetical protein